LATTDQDIVATVDSSDSAFKINRKLGLDGYAIVNSSAALSANVPFNKIFNQTASHVTGSLSDPTFDGQIQIVLGLATSSGDCLVEYTNPLGTTTTKTLSNGIGLMLICVDVTGGGVFRWAPIGDVS